MVDKKKPILDTKQLESLRELNEPDSPNEDIVTELIDIFLDQSPDTLKLLKDEIEHKNAVMIERLAHKLKGSSANLGAEYLRSLCQKVEEKVRVKAFDELEKLIIEIEIAFDEACSLLKRDWRKPAA